METVVFYNAGKAARLSGLARECPETYAYPIVSNYTPYREETVTVEGVFRQSWFDGFDGKYDRLR